MNTRAARRLPLRRAIPWIGAALALLPWVLPMGPAPVASQGGGACVLRAELDGIVNAGTASYLQDAVAESERRRCVALLVVIDTPGGMLEETRRIVRAFLGAQVAVIAYVAPRGARAGSAGVFITLAAHVAAMAPGTNIGAAHPVVGTGQDPEKAGGEHMAEKVENDTAAFARSIAEERGRNLEWAEAAVRESKSATAREALELGIIDRIASDEATLLDALEGFSVHLEGGPQALSLSGARLIDFEPTLQQRALEVLGNPNLAYALLMLGLLGIVVELQNPGLAIPGALGALCLLLGAIGLNLLPVNLGGIALLVIAAALMVAEMYISSYGLLTAAALGCLLLGSALLIDQSDPRFFADADVRLSWGSVLPLAALLSLGSLLLALTAARLRGRRAAGGSEGLVGECGKALSALGPEGGQVFIHGERWRAVSDVPMDRGAAIEVVAVDGLTLQVRTADTRQARSRNPGDSQRKLEKEAET
ncbi:MAG: nodulation protein NfeD [Myxococcales bacterium]|nr:nodulation protein NfeD [Myxococcales bacterium]